MLRAGALLDLQTFIAAADFNIDNQPVNIYQIFLDYQNANKLFIAAVLDSATTSVFKNGTNYVWGEQKTGDDFITVTTVTSGTITWTSGSTKRYVITNNTTTSLVALSTVRNVYWVYISNRIYAILQDAGFTEIKAVHSSNIKVFTTIGTSVFSSTAISGDLIIPNTVTSLGGSSFRYCSGLNGRLVLPDSIAILNSYTFNGCAFTGRLFIPDSVTQIKTVCFYGCQFTGDLIIPALVTNIEDAAFRAIPFNGALTILSTTLVFVADNVNLGGSAGSFGQCSGFTALNLPVGYSSSSLTFRFSNNFSADSLNQSILNITDGTKTFTIGTTNKNRLTAAYPNAVTNAATRGITIV